MKDTNEKNYPGQRRSSGFLRILCERRTTSRGRGVRWRHRKTPQFQQPTDEMPVTWNRRS